MRRKPQSRFLVALAFLLTLPVPQEAQSTSPPPWTNEYRVTLFPHYPIKGNLSGFSHLGWVKNPDSQYTNWYGGFPGFIYKARPWFQVWSGMLAIYTNNYTKENGKQDTLELRPFIGWKAFLPNKKRWSIYNFTRWEFRQTYSHATHEWTSVERVRARFGIEAPITDRENAWTIKSFYAIANTEPTYRFDKDELDPFRVQMGVGYIANPRVRMELLYYANWSRVAPSNDFAFTENIFRLNIKIGVKHSLLREVLNPMEK
jgi:hypothetical protein